MVFGSGFRWRPGSQRAAADASPTGFGGFSARLKYSVDTNSEDSLDGN